MNYEITAETLEEFGIAYDLHFWWNNDDVFIFKYENYEINVMLQAKNIIVRHKNKKIMIFKFNQWYHMLDFIDFQF